MTKLRAGMAKVRARTDNCRILCVGDSTTYGYYGDATRLHMNGLTAQAAKMAGRLGTDINGNSIVGGWQNIVGSGGLTTANLITNDTRFAVNTTDWTNALSAIGGTAYRSTSGGNSFSFTPNVSVDVFDVWYIQNSTAGSMSLDIDGGTASVFSCNNAVTSLVKRTINASSIGTHTLNIKWSSGQFVAVVAIEARNRAQYEVSFLNAGWPGSTAVSWATGAAAWQSVQAPSYMLPDGIVLSLGINDWGTSTGVSAYTTALQTLITAYRAVSDVILITPYPSAITSGISLATQQTYVDAMKELAISNNLPLIDLFGIWQSYEVQNSLGYYFNAQHPTGLGFNDAASLLLAAIRELTS